MNKEDIQKALNDEISAGEKQYGLDFKLRIIKILALEKELNPPVGQKESRRIPLSQWNEFHSYPSVGTMYQYNMNAKQNGFDYCIEHGGQNGGRVIIVEDKFWEWHANRKKNS